MKKTKIYFKSEVLPELGSLILELSDLQAERNSDTSLSEKAADAVRAEFPDIELNELGEGFYEVEIEEEITGPEFEARIKNSFPLWEIGTWQ